MCLLYVKDLEWNLCSIFGIQIVTRPMLAIIGAIFILLPFVGYILDGKDHGDVWRGIRYIFGFILALVPFFLSIKFLGVWSVLVFPVLLIVALYLRKFRTKVRETSLLDRRMDDI